MLKQQAQVTCKSVFKNGENALLKSQFNRKWIEFINQIEKTKKTTHSANDYDNDYDKLFSV